MDLVELFDNLLAEGDGDDDPGLASGRVVVERFPEGRRLDVQVSPGELSKALTSLQVFWAAANSSRVQNLMELSCSNTLRERALALVLSGPEM